MIEISEEELVRYLESYAEGKITMTDLVKKLNTDYRGFNNRIMKMSIEYPELYRKIVEKHPYKQKNRDDIDYEALMIYIIKNDMTINEAIEEFGISRRTIQRRVNEIKDKNPELYELFKQVMFNNQIGKSNQKLIDEINKLELSEVVISEENETREKYLLEMEKEFNDLVMSGMSRKKAANQMGYTKNYMDKLLNELYRIKIEKEVKEQKKINSNNNGFKESLKYNGTLADNENKSIKYNKQIDEREKD